MIWAAFAWLRSSWLGKALAFALATLAAIALIRRDAAKDARHEDERKDTEDALRVHKSADQALRDADGADAVDFLRKHGAIRRDGE